VMDIADDIAYSVHDLGHPPFGHLGEQVLDRVARTRLGLPDGFEGNAQTFRILTALDSCDATARGLNLTKAVRAAVLKYPWTRNEWRSLPPQPAERLPRGVGSDSASGALKFSAYSIDALEMADVLSAFPAIGRHQQTLECSVMDIADDIAYSVHDLDDFYRAGVLQFTSVSAELNGWLQAQSALAALSTGDLMAGVALRRPGYALEAAWRHTYAKDSWIANAEAFRASVVRVTYDLVEGLLTIPYDGGLEADRAVSAFTRRWIDRLKGSIRVERTPNVRSGHVRLGSDAWHDVVVLKFVHTRFVLDRSDLAVYQRGQARVLETLADGFHLWLNDADDAARAPRRLIDSIEAATAEYRELRANAPEYFAAVGAGTSDQDIARFGRSRAVVDYIASFTDAQAMSVAALISGTSDSLWESGRSL
ncbi:MAG TPA: phosphodiesterase, partial [Microterricola sp.]